MGPKIKVMGDRLLLMPLPGKEEVSNEMEQTPGGLYIPPGSSASKRGADRLKWATVIRVGSKVEDINENDIVLYDKMAAADIPIDGEVYTIIRGSDLIAART